MRNKKINHLLALGIFLFIFLYLYQRSRLPFWHDSLAYWELAGSFLSDGKFSILNYSSSLRGYLYPFLLYLVRWQAGLVGVDARIVFVFYTAIFFAIICIFILPGFFDRVFAVEIPPVGKLVIALLFFYFWRGYFIYPLSDFPALAALLVGLTLLPRNSDTGWKAIMALAAGMCFAASINIRPAYQISLPFVVLLIFAIGRKYGSKNISTSVALSVLGFAVVLLPQLLINRLHFRVTSPFVLATYLDNADIYSVQLFWGLKTQKVMTNIGDTYPYDLVVYEDPLTEHLPRTGRLEKNLRNYVDIVKKIPAEVAVSYFRHAFNGLDPFFATPYVKNIFASHRLFSLINYSIWFLVLWSLLKFDPERINVQTLFSVLCLLAPVGLAIPIVVEVRFFLPGYILAYGLVSLRVNKWDVTLNTTTGRWRLVRAAILYLAWIIACFAISAGTEENLVLF